MSEKVTVILITGPPGVGKSTLVRKICAELPKIGVNCKGFYTEEVRNPEKLRVGFDVVLLYSQGRGILAREYSRGMELKPRIGKYSVFVQDFEELAIPLLTRKQSSAQQLLVLDEVGKMELLSKRFADAVNALVKQKVPILATIPLKTREPLATVELLKSAAKSYIFHITKTNRNQIQKEIVQQIAQMFCDEK